MRPRPDSFYNPQPPNKAAAAASPSALTPSPSSNSSAARPQQRPPSAILPFAATTPRGRNERPSAFASLRQPSSTRPPLRPKDRNQPQHVTLLTTSTTRSTIASAAKMPAAGDRPRQPQLSAAPARALNRTPLTPKIAVRTTPLATPLPRRPQAARDDAATPGASSVSCSTSTPATSNITPRSGTRQSRVNSLTSTPTGTPNLPDRGIAGWDNGAGMGLGLPGPGSAAPGQAGDSSGENKFFYASDARTMQQPPPLQRPASVPQKPVSFFYANGTSADARRAMSPPVSRAFTPVLAPTQEPVATKFFYANGLTGLAPSRQTPPASALSTSSRMTPARPGTSSSATGPAASATQRPASPIKAASTPTVHTLSASLMSPSGPDQPPSASSPLAPTAGKRRVSVGSAPKGLNRGHARAGSVPSTDPVVSPKLATSPTSSQPASPPQSPGLSQSVMTMASLLQAEGDNGDERDAKAAEVASPIQSSHVADPVRQVVANARRERKVQDLEITNASLEAINRTLERQLRKQTAELRRFRRLSRSGRISLASVSSTRVPSEALTDRPVDLSDLTEEEATEQEDDQDEDEDEELDSLDGSELSSDESVSTDKPLSPSAKIALRRRRDERRLQLDLTKHQELLVDSQKMNQSLKRCLNWTEVLIKEGQKALQYHVRVSDVEFGGRVLAPPDEDDEDNVSHMEDTTAKVGEQGLGPPWTKGPQDRDSGIELPADGG